jgi:hypothetical protein
VVAPHPTLSPMGRGSNALREACRGEARGTLASLPSASLSPPLRFGDLRRGSAAGTCGPPGEGEGSATISRSGRTGARAG